MILDHKNGRLHGQKLYWKFCRQTANLAAWSAGGRPWVRSGASLSGEHAEPGAACPMTASTRC